MSVTTVPNGAFADFWQRLAAHYQDEAVILGSGLMNAPRAKWAYAGLRRPRR